MSYEIVSIWPWPLSNDLGIQIIPRYYKDACVYSKTEVHTFNGSNVIAWTDTQTDTQTDPQTGTQIQLKFLPIHIRGWLKSKSGKNREQTLKIFLFEIFKFWFHFSNTCSPQNSWFYWLLTEQCVIVVYTTSTSK